VCQKLLFYKYRVVLELEVNSLLALQVRGDILKNGGAA